MKKLEVKHKDGWYYNPDELRRLTERVNGQEYGEAMSMEEVEAVLLAIDESTSTEPKYTIDQIRQAGKEGEVNHLDVEHIIDLLKEQPCGQKEPLYRWVRASEIYIDYRQKYIAKRADDETIFFTGRFQKSDGTFFWENNPGYVPMLKNQYDILLILCKVEPPEQDELWKEMLQHIFENGKLTLEEDIELCKSKYLLIKK